MSRREFAVKHMTRWQVVFLMAISADAQQCLLQVGSLHGRLAVGPDTIELKVGNASTGLKMPLLGFGTCCRATAKGPALKESIAAYLQHGGRLVDTAIMYDNHKDVGEALETAFQSGTVSREQLWVTSKIAPNHAETDIEAINMLDESLRDLKLDYVDLFLIHAPGANSVEIWRGLVKAKAEGKTKAIGVSNFSPDDIQKLELAGLERPSVNQIEFHPWVDADVFENVAWCLSHGVAVTAYGSLGSSYHDGLEDPKVKQSAVKHGKTTAQVLLSWALHQGVAVVPGATSEEHIVDDLQSRSFDLDADETRSDYFTH